MGFRFRLVAKLDLHRGIFMQRVLTLYWRWLRPQLAGSHQRISRVETFFIYCLRRSGPVSKEQTFVSLNRLHIFHPSPATVLCGDHTIGPFAYQLDPLGRLQVRRVSESPRDQISILRGEMETCPARISNITRFPGSPTKSEASASKWAIS